MHLIHLRDQVVAKTELLDEVRGDRYVTGLALTSRIETQRATGGSVRSSVTTPLASMSGLPGCGI
ncbi:hypothetical protein GCM10022267_84880 [Lentzea roselyniae]|uniref:Uncharacterized protein n=1 Tax=Lentzea roselyniae TaxID=531940 RepID=A0ABP7CEA4_9PSEU